VFIFTRHRSSISGTDDHQPDSEVLPQYQVDKTFADRRYKVHSARTFFYLNEATCERNMETFIECLEAVSGECFRLIYVLFCG
jgi:proline dehydrogenase